LFLFLRSVLKLKKFKFDMQGISNLVWWGDFANDLILLAGIKIKGKIQREKCSGS